MSSMTQRCMQLWQHFGLSHLLRECEPQLDSPPDSRYLQEQWEQLLRRNMRIHVLTLAYMVACLNFTQVQRTQPDYKQVQNTAADLTKIQCAKPKNMLQTRVQPQHKDAGFARLHWLVPAPNGKHLEQISQSSKDLSWFLAERSPPSPISKNKCNKNCLNQQVLH